MQTDAKELVGILEKTKSLMEEEESIRKKMQVIRWVFPLLIVGIFALYVYLFYSTVKNVEEDKFFTKLEQNMVRVWPIFGDEFKRVAAELSPVYAQEIEKAAIDALPDLETKLTQEMEKRMVVLRERITADLNRSLGKLYEKQKTILHAEIPELAQDDKATGQVIRAVNVATIAWVEELLSKTIQDHAVALIDLKEVLDRNFRKGEEEKERIDTEQLLTLWIEVMNQSLGSGKLDVSKKRK